MRRPIQEVTSNVFSRGRSRRMDVANVRAMFMRPGTVEVPRGLMGLGGLWEEVQAADSLPLLRKQLAKAQAELVDAKREFDKCGGVTDVGDFLLTTVSGGTSKAYCRMKWGGQVNHFQDLIKMAQGKIDALEDAGAQTKSLETFMPDEIGISTGRSAITGRQQRDPGGSSGASKAGGVPTWAMALGGAILLGGAVFLIARRKK